MANPDLVRKALLALMGAKKQNKAVAGGQGIPAGPNELNRAEMGVRNARQDVQQVQGSDPLNNPFREGQNVSGTSSAGRFQGPHNPDDFVGGREPPYSDIPQGNPQRLRELDNAPSRASDDPPSIPGRFSDEAPGMRKAANAAEDSSGIEEQLIRRYEQLTGQPFNDELSMPEVQKVVDILTQGNKSAPSIDDIPF